MAASVIARETPKFWVRMARFIIRELRDIWPPTLFFFIGFNLVLFTKRLELEQYSIRYSGLVIATTGALIVAKAVLVADAMPFLRRFDRRPLAWPILFKTVVYTCFVVLARLLEEFIVYLAHKGAVGGGAFVEQVFGTFSWARFTATQLWILVLFLVYVTASAFNELLGDGELFKLFFKRPSTNLQSARRRRMRLLTRLSLLTEAHPLDVLTDRQTPPHAELAAILSELARTAQQHPLSGGN
jgi:hypothetical protein